jgi:hypothetical protein
VMGDVGGGRSRGRKAGVVVSTFLAASLAGEAVGECQKLEIGERIGGSGLARIFLPRLVGAR